MPLNKRGVFMLHLTNPLFSALVDYKNKRNELNKHDIIIEPSYKLYDKNENGVYKFRVWDIVVDIKRPNNLSEDKFTLLGEIKYEGSLNFVIDEQMKTIFIYNLPTKKYYNQEIKVLTSDILSIINNIAKKYVNVDDFDLKFINNLTLCVIDEKAKEIFSAIENAKPYINLNRIADQISKEEDKIKSDVLKYKAQLEKKDRAYENALSKKRTIFGVDPEHYSCEDRDEVISNRIKEVYTKRIENARRHLEKSKAKFISIISSHPDFYVKDRSKFSFYENIDRFYNSLDWDNFDYEENLMPYDEYVERVVDYETWSGSIPIIQEARECFEDFLAVKRESEKSWKTFYDLVRDCYKNRQRLSNDASIVFEFLGKEFENAIDLIWQISQLENQIENYKKFLQNPSNQIIGSFSQESGSWGAVMQNDTWVRYGRETTKKWARAKKYYHLFMTKPGVSKIDFEKTKKYTRKNGYEFGHNIAERLEKLEQMNEKNWQTEKVETRCVCMLTKSLCYDNIVKIVNETLDKTHGSIFVVESPDQAAQVKRLVYLYLIQKINELKQEWHEEQQSIVGIEDERTSWWGEETRQTDLNAKYFRNLEHFMRVNGLIGIFVDHNYYKNFFTKTPANKNLYYYYINTGKLKNVGEEFARTLAREMNIAGLECTNMNHVKIKDRQANALNLFNNINWKNIDEAFLGGYSKDSNKKKSIKVSDKQALIKRMVKSAQYQIIRNKQLELESLEDNMPSDINLDNSPDLNVDLTSIFNYASEATREEYLTAIENGLIYIEDKEFEQEK